MYFLITLCVCESLCMITCMRTTFMPCIHGGQKRTMYPQGLRMLKDGCELPCGFWELSPGSLKAYQVLSTVEPSLHPKRSLFFKQIRQHNILPSWSNYDPRMENIHCDFCVHIRSLGCVKTLPFHQL